MDELFELLLDAGPFDWLLGLFGAGGPSGGRFEPGPSVAELRRAIDRENGRRQVGALARLEHDRRAGRLSLPEFGRRYARLAGREPSADPARMELPYGPNSAALEDFLGRVRAMDAAGWDAAERHLDNLQANVVVRTTVLPRYRAALDAATGAARLSAAAAVEEAIGAAVPEARHETWGLVLRWLPVVLVTDAGTAPTSLAAPLGG